MSRIAVIDRSKCKPHLCGWACMKKCPVNMTGAECIYDDNAKAGIDEELCTGCGICPKICPFDAIQIINLPEVSTNPIHQYGPNGFRIFDLPLVQEGSITGIIGRNGIGKSTVINVLSHTLEANFGLFGEEKITKDKYFSYLTQKFKGTLLQSYFTKLEKEEISISYKPQQITTIPKIFSGTVGELLKKVNPNEKEITTITTQLNISQILDRDIKVLSGGELQRVALASSLLKSHCNFFIFDEVTNYLDIYERINSAKLIKEQTAQNTSMVVEHDLVVLDFLVDYVHIMYGQPTAYGRLTGVKNAKMGINEYLHGYTKEENIRFRDKPITFEKESDSTHEKTVTLASWKPETLSQGNFTLSIESGDIREGEVIGIVGRNALGKSTFISHIAKQGFDNATVSYKEQLISTNDNLVMSELAQFNNYKDPFYEINILDPLNITPLLEKQVNQLSGGELQRYAIAKCLLQDADVYLLDEPTAFLDIEDRLKVAKMIKNFIELKGKSSFIIDHDIVFMDYLSNRLLVFDGNPSIEGIANTPQSMRDGMNHFLKGLDITFRRDENNKRPRVNKPDSVKDQQQKSKGEYYYA